MISRPRRKKITGGFIIIASRAEADLNNNIDNGLWEQAMYLAPAITTLMQSDDTNWTDEQRALWTASEALVDAFNAPTESDGEFERLVGDVALAAAEV